MNEREIPMQVLDFMNKHSNWEELLTQLPYNIVVKHDGDYVLLKYNKLASDFSIPIVRECRGSIFRWEVDRWICVCRPFEKFGNYGESYVPELDWDSSHITEKIDGSLIKVWHDRGEWHISTNGTIDAFKATIGEDYDDSMSFGSIFKAAVGDCYWDEFLSQLDVSYTYMFFVFLLFLFLCLFYVPSFSFYSVISNSIVGPVSSPVT